MFYLNTETTRQGQRLTDPETGSTVGTIGYEVVPGHLNRPWRFSGPSGRLISRHRTLEAGQYAALAWAIDTQPQE